MANVQQTAFLKTGGKGWAGKGWGKGKWGFESPKDYCVTHSKRRSKDCLTPDGAGGFVCKAENRCQVSSDEPAEAGGRERGVCALHGKTRSMDCLDDDGAGGVRCVPGKACKQTGESDWWDPWSWMWGMGLGGGGWRPGGPDLPRKRVTGSQISGIVVEWKGKFGWIKPDEAVNNPLAEKHGGKIYVSSKDVQGGVTELAAGGLVMFHVYSDSSGLGAEEVLYTAP